MQIAPTNWNTIFKNINHKKEYRITISESDGSNPVTYGMEIIKNMSVESALLSSNQWIGNCISKKLSMTLLTTVTVPRMAMISIDVRLVLNNSHTNYIPVGIWWVDERSYSSLWTNLICYDAMLKTEQTFINEELETGTWPITMVDAIDEICTRIDVTLDERSNILTDTDYVVPYTNDLTMREVLQNIAVAHGGNWTITPNGKLRLVSLSGASTSPVLSVGQSIKNFTEGDTLTISKVVLYDDADNSFEAGDDSGYTLSADCLYATTNITNDLGNTSDGTLYGISYVPFEASSVYLNPLFELGDDISINGIKSIIYTANITLSTDYPVDISCPYEQEVDHEYPYLSTIERQNNRTVKLNKSYYGTTISRTNGLTIDKLVSDVVTAKAIFNADTLSMQSFINGNWVDKLYFDPTKGTYVFDGILSADTMNTIELTAKTGYIANLTVDRLYTETKLQNYLKLDTSDINYIKIEGQEIQFITASTDGITTTPATDRNGNLLYWTDNTYTTTTTEETDYQALIFLYTEVVKMSISFVLSNGEYIPKITLGIGAGVGNNGKAYVYKDTNGLTLQYYTTDNGTLRQIELSDDGIIAKGSTGIKGIRNVTVSTTPPADPELYEEWICPDSTVGE